ncbi:MAG TPA: hypothetical protein VMD91_03890 [Candidatus Sulfotelmatobacter sp.]|nr:hypothetical protein [Candidatus Sulfotelmatobacter sp.]
MSPIRFLTTVALAAAVAAPTAAFAQSTGPNGPPPAGPPAAAGPAGMHHGHHRHNRFLHALRGLKLSDAQRAQIRDTVRQTFRANRGLDPQTRRTNLRAMRQKVEAILTPDQRARFHAALQRHRERVNPGGPMIPAQPPAGAPGR